MTGETIVSMVFGVCVGVAATVTMDVLASASRRVGLAAGAKGQWVGRWYLGIARGQFVHSNIAAAPEQAGEKWAALVGHYAIGIALAVLYVVGAGWLGVSPGVFLVALGYGFAKGKGARHRLPYLCVISLLSPQHPVPRRPPRSRSPPYVASPLSAPRD